MKNLKKYFAKHKDKDKLQRWLAINDEVDKIINFDPELVRERLRLFCEKNNISTSKLSIDLGLNRNYLRLYLSDKSSGKNIVAVICSLITLYNLSIDWFFGFTDECPKVKKIVNQLAEFNVKPGLQFDKENATKIILAVVEHYFNGKKNAFCTAFNFPLVAMFYNSQSEIRFTPVQLVTILMCLGLYFNDELMVEFLNRYGIQKVKEIEINTQSVLNHDSKQAYIYDGIRTCFPNCAELYYLSNKHVHANVYSRNDCNYIPKGHLYFSLSIPIGMLSNYKDFVLSFLVEVTQIDGKATIANLAKLTKASIYLDNGEKVSITKIMELKLILAVVKIKE